MDIQTLLGAVGGILTAAGFIYFLRTDNHTIKSLAVCFVGIALMYIAFL
jgi:hypothetical protein